jgi:hypothetical protein
MQSLGHACIFWTSKPRGQWLAVLATQWGTPRGRYDEHNGKFPLVWNQGLIEPVGERTNFRRLMLAGLATAPDNLYMAPYLGHCFAPAATWNLHTTQRKYFAPTSSEVVNLTVTRVNSTNVQYEGLRIGGIGRRMNLKVNQSNKVCIESKCKSKLGLLSICPLPSPPGPYI